LIEFRKYLIWLTVVALGACANVSVDTSDMMQDGVAFRQPLVTANSTETGQTICAFPEAQAAGGKSNVSSVRDAFSGPYAIGPGDTLRLNLFGEEGMRDLLVRVDSQGYIQVPIIAPVQVEGKTTRQIQSQLARAYSTVFLDAWVTVQLEDAVSKPIYFLGEFREPGVKYLERPMDLLQSLGMANGLEEDAFLPGGRLMRRDRVCPVDLFALLREGDFRQNIEIQPFDVLFVPARQDMSVYVLGAVGSPGEVPFGSEGRSLLEVIAMSGGVPLGSARIEEVRVIRSYSPVIGEMFVIDMAAMLRGEARDFQLEPNDVVFVPRSSLGSWNEAIAEILPSLQLISSALTPYALLVSLNGS
jgi:polysaccharide export outer membrane protein